MRGWMREKRVECGLTQQDVAQAIGISKQYYQQIENNARQQDLNSSLIMGLAQVFNMSAIDIVNQEAQND